MALLGQREGSGAAGRRGAAARGAAGGAGLADQRPAPIAGRERSPGGVAASAGLEADAAALNEVERRAGELRLQTVALADEVNLANAQLTTLKVAARPRRSSGGRPRARPWSACWCEGGPIRRRGRRASSRDDGGRPGALPRRCARMSVVLRQEAELAQAEAEARAREHGERQGALEARQATLAEREAVLRTARAEVVPPGANCCRQPRCAARRWRCGAPGSRSRSSIVIERSSWARVVYDYHLRALFGAVEEQRDHRAAWPHRADGRDQPDRHRGVGGASVALRFSHHPARRPGSRPSACSRRQSRKSTSASRKRFRETLNAVNLKSQSIFPRLFGGGKSQPGAHRRERFARDRHRDRRHPPGKKVSQNIELLSGGEKALTAVSLLFASSWSSPRPSACSTRSTRRSTRPTWAASIRWCAR